MIEDKNIDRLFQEKLKDMEVAPHPKVWNAIEKKLQNKKRRIVPIWWFSSGVAATLILGLILFSDGFQKKQDQNNNFPIITNKSIDKNIENQVNTSAKETIVSDKTTKNIDTNKPEEEKELNFLINKGNKTDIVATKDKEFLKTIEKEAGEKEKNSAESILNTAYSADRIAKKKVFKQQLRKKKGTDNLKKEFVLVAEKIAEKEGKNNSEGGIVKGISSSEGFTVKKKVKLQKKEKAIKKDFIAQITKEKEADKKEPIAGKKWTVSPIFGILKSRTFSQTSALSASLNNKAVSGEQTIAYGVNFDYKLTNRWSLKSGIQLQKTAFTTNDVTLTKSAFLVANSLDNVVFVNNENNLVNDQSTVDNSDLETEQGNLQQAYGYIEIPIEVKYTFLTSKNIKTSIISGFSSLFLSENSIVSNSATFKGDIGEANNLNSINFSGNIGLDIDFKLSKKLNLNINPMFKTQLNTFSKNSNGFKPYLIGVYTGIKYEF